MCGKFEAVARQLFGDATPARSAYGKGCPLPTGTPRNWNCVHRFGNRACPTRASRRNKARAAAAVRGRDLSGCLRGPRRVWPSCRFASQKCCRRPPPRCAWPQLQSAGRLHTRGLEERPIRAAAYNENLLVDGGAVCVLAQEGIAIPPMVSNPRCPQRPVRA